MDVDELEGLLDAVESLWPRPLEDHELAAWRRMLSPACGADLDPQLVDDTLLVLKGLSEFKNVRPSTGAFKAAYDRKNRVLAPPPPSDPTLQPVTKERAGELLAHVRQQLQPKPAAAEPEVEEQLL